VRLYLVRHGEAAPGEPDELRPLTQEGREQARALGERLRGENASPAVVLTSPLLRARETGGELARALDVESEPDERLAPGASADDVRAAIEGRGDQVVVVGHQPDCGRIAAALTGGPEPRFPAGGLVVVELD
jgi:phosphohistidine phosphatase